MNIMDEHRRKEVDQLLKDGTDAKLLRGGTEIALSKIKKAYELAIAQPRLPPPWPQLAAYRLAHLLLRSDANSNLPRVKVLFEEATSGNYLGPVPQIYYLAALQRIRNTASDQEDRRKFDHQIKIVHQDAYASLQRSLAGQLDIQADAEELSHRAPLQDGLVNLLEITTYFLGLPYVPLEGIDGPYSNLLLSDQQDGKWFLVGPDPTIATVHYTRQLAVIELEARGQENPDAILFRLPEYPERAAWKKPGTKWQMVSERHIRLLTCLLMRQNWRRLDLRDKLVGDETGNESGADALFRQVISRTRKGLTKLTKMPGEKILQSDSATHVRYHL